MYKKDNFYVRNENTNKFEWFDYSTYYHKNGNLSIEVKNKTSGEDYKVLVDLTKLVDEFETGRVESLDYEDMSKYITEFVKEFIVNDYEFDLYNCVIKKAAKYEN